MRNKKTRQVQSKLNAAALAGVARRPPEVADSVRLQTLQNLLDQRNAATLADASSRSAEGREPADPSGASGAVPATGESADTVRRELHALLSQQHAAPAAESGPSGLLTAVPMGIRYVPVSAPPSESAESVVRLQMLADLAERSKGGRKKEEDDQSSTMDVWTTRTWSDWKSFTSQKRTCGATVVWSTIQNSREIYWS